MRKRVDVIATRRTEKHRSGRPKKMNDDLMNEMLDSKRNPARDQPYEAQIEHFQLNAERRTLQRAFHNRRPRVSRFKKARIRTISQKNMKLRVEYELNHQYHTIDDYWQYVHFIDEAHFDSHQTFEERVLREEGTRYESKNLQTMPEMKGVKLHVAASISWHHKGALQFYNDEHDLPNIQIKKPRKPRRTKAMTNEQYQQKVAEWEASLPHDVDIKSQGNSMTQAYYTKRLLPIYVEEIHRCRVSSDRACIFQEDNDPSHDTRSAVNIVRQFKEAN